jgi:hypothetical protein
MLSISRRALAIAAFICALTVAYAPNAMAHEFEVKQIKGTVQLKGANTQVFESGGAKVECTKTEGSGPVQLLKTETISEAVEYSGCKAFGEPATVSQAKYLFKANGTTSLENEVTIKAAGPKCEFKIPVAGNENLGTITYSNIQTGIEAKASVTGITSTGGGAGPLCVKGTNKTSKYSGVVVGWYLGCDLTLFPNGFWIDPYCRIRSEPIYTGWYEIFWYPIIWR